MESEQNRFLLPRQPPAPRRKRWGECWGGLSCFRKQKGGKRIVPSRMPEANAAPNPPNGPHVGLMPNQTVGIAPSLYAPPSSPASFSNSALHSTAQSPSCFLSANSPGNPSSTMFVTGPYAHETQLVSPPVFSTFTTEPSTAPLTPPPELAHLTTPSSPDVPYAHFLSSSANIKTTDKTTYTNDLQATYSLYPGSPASTLRSPVLASSPKYEPSTPSQESTYTKSDLGHFGLQPGGAPKSRQDSNFFCPETFAQFYLDQSSFPHSGGRLSISKESDAYSNGGNGHQNRQSKISKPDAEELEAYRASFGFSADEIITTTHYVEISDALEDSFSMPSLSSNKSAGAEHVLTAPWKGGVGTEKSQEDFPSPPLDKAGLDHAEEMHSEVPKSYEGLQVKIPQKRNGDVSGRSFPSIHIMSDDEDTFSKMGTSRTGRKYPFGSSNSDAEIGYRRGRSLREKRSWGES